MLIEFRFKNYRSFRDEAVLSMEAVGLGALKQSLIPFKNKNYLPSAAIFGKNAGGKSNVIRAFWLAVQFITNAQMTQHENSPIPVRPFRLDDYSADEPTEFDFVYTVDGIRYWYSFSATREKIYTESLFHAPKGQKALVFSRKGQDFTFTTEKAKRKMIAKTIAPNQLFFSVACTMNDACCIRAMKWFREDILFSRDYSDEEMPRHLMEYSEDKNMLRSISDYAREADLGIEDMEFKLDQKEIDDRQLLPDELPDDVKNALFQFRHALSDSSDGAEGKLKMSQIKATAFHRGINRNGEAAAYPLSLQDESDGTRRLMSIAPAIEKALQTGGILLADEIEKGLHPLLVEYIIARFGSKETNKHGAQLIFTSHDTELLNMNLLRKDQLYFADKSESDGSSSLYSISDLGTRTSENVRKSYLNGKYGAIPNIEIEEVV